MPRTKNVGAPWLSRSLVSGSARQSSRIRSSVPPRSAGSPIDRESSHARRVQRACVHGCYSRSVERIGIRKLRNETTRAVRRAMAGERLVITIDGVPAAQIGPLNDGLGAASVEDLIGAGLLQAPLTTAPAAVPRPVKAPCRRTTTEILREHRDR